MPAFLLELFSEEIPARMQREASEHLARAFASALEAAGLKAQGAQSFVTPRRLALRMGGLPESQPDVTIEKKGPKTSAPQAAIDGFAKSLGLPLPLGEGRGEGGVTIEKRMVGKDETYFAIIHQKGQPTAAVLRPIVEKILADFPWPKSMRWGSGETRWVRPLHSILCLLGDTVIPVRFAGLTAGNITYGHRFLAPAAITISNPADYEAALKGAKVIADAEARKAAILKQAEALAAGEGLSLRRDDGLLAEVTGLVEWPVALMGTIDARFMDLPPEVLTSEMRAHQKYFALLGKDGTLSPRFLIVSNMVTADAGKAVIAGNERVLRARLSDGRFFFDQDRKKPLSEWAKGLEKVTFHAKIGTIAQKVQRIEKLALQFVPGVESSLRGANATKQSSLADQVQRAASLCKADLTTGMVGEFPELQGVMGRYYALAQKEDAAVADAIRDHYLPLGPDSPIPNKPVSICVALADKLDTLIMMFNAGEKPTGSKDPFALRRSALGIIRIILENQLRLPLKTWLSDELLAFFRDRLKVMLRDQGIRHDVIDAVMANGDDDLTRVVERAKAFQSFIESDDGANLLAAYKRANNILDIEEKKDKTVYDKNPSVVSDKAKAEDLALIEAEMEILPKAKEAIDKEDFVNAMRIISTLRKPVDVFFEKALVNTDDVGLRINRLNTLGQLRRIFNLIADFSQIQG